jgi:hypothetical protein
MVAILEAFPAAAQADQGSDGSTVVESRITSAGLFKNGLAVVRRTVTLPADGTYEIRNVPEPVHGTFWIESDAVTETRVTTRQFEAPLAGRPVTDLSGDLAGKHVTIHFRDGIPAISGRVADRPPERGSDAWSRAYEQPAYGRWGWWSTAPPRNVPAPNARFLLLETDTGLVYVDTSTIAQVHVKDPNGVAMRRRPVLLITASGLTREPATVVISYLAKGIAWAPSYRLDISDPATLLIEQKAVIRNELEDLDDVEIELISGFPSVEFSHVLSPLSPRTTWASFFTQLSQRFAPERGSMRGVVTQQAVMYNAPPPGPGVDMPVIPTGDGVDLHYHAVGRRTLLEGDSLMLRVAEGRTAYERIVEWVVPDTRNADGRFIEEWQRQQNPEQYRDAAWDALRFRNPLDFPMTTGPATIIAADRFNGQRTSHWVSPGELSTLRVTKALSIRTRSSEQEEPGDREIVHIGGRRFRKPNVKGQLLVRNHRQETITLVVRRQFSGELIEADGEPRLELREEGVYSVNPRNELTWTISLEPGEERSLRYRYSVLVYH